MVFIFRIGILTSFYLTLFLLSSLLFCSFLCTWLYIRFSVYVSVCHFFGLSFCRCFMDCYSLFSRELDPFFFSLIGSGSGETGPGSTTPGRVYVAKPSCKWSILLLHQSVSYFSSHWPEHHNFGSGTGSFFFGSLKSRNPDLDPGFPNYRSRIRI